MKEKGILYDLNWKYSIYPIKSSDIMKENYDKQFTCNQELWPLYGVYSKQHRWWLTKSKYLVTNVMTSWRENMSCKCVIRNFNLLSRHLVNLPNVAIFLKLANHFLPFRNDGQNLMGLRMRLWICHFCNLLTTFAGQQSFNMIFSLYIMNVRLSLTILLLQICSFVHAVFKISPDGAECYR